MSAKLLDLGDKVVVEFDTGPQTGVIVSRVGKKYNVEFGDNETALLKLSQMRPVLDDEDEDADDEYGDGSPPPDRAARSAREEFPSGGGRGFNLYPIVWKDTNFGIDMEDGSRFYGCWRRTTYGYGAGQQEGFAIDMWAKYKGHEYSVVSIPYLLVDPRSDMKSLNSDVCAAISKFMFEIENNSDTLETLRRKATRPRIHINRMESLDAIIYKLTELRNIALRSGGQRIIAIEGDREGGVVMGISVDLTRQAALLDGRDPPAIETGQSAIYDDPHSGRAANFKADPRSIAILVEKLRTTKNKSEARKLRQVLRRMGHRGGARSVGAITQADISNPETVTEESED